MLVTVIYLLDNNICIYIAKKRPLEVYQKLSELSIGDVGMPLITFGELRFGSENSVLHRMERETRMAKPNHPRHLLSA